MTKNHGSWKAFSPLPFYPFGSVTEDNLAATIADQAREELGYIRDKLTEYRLHVGRKVVKGTDKYEYMGGHAFLNMGLWALHAVCDRFKKVCPLDRLVKVLRRHCVRTDEQLKALYEQDKAQVQVMQEVARKERLAELLS